MDFVMSLPNNFKGSDTISVVVERLNKSAHFSPIKISYSLQKLAEVYIEKIANLHGIPLSICLDRDLRFTSRFWESFQEALGTRLRLSSTYHRNMDAQIERIIQSLKDMLRACVLEQRGNWDTYLLLIEFTYNNNFHSSIGMVAFEELYGKRCRTHLCWYESGKSVVLFS